MTIRKTYKEIWHELELGARTTLRGFCRLGWAIVLLPANVAATCACGLHRGIKAAPLAAVIVTAGLGIVINMGVYADCRYKIETLTWQRDQNAMKIDSMLILSGMKEAPRGWWQHYGTDRHE